MNLNRDYRDYFFSTSVLSTLSPLLASLNSFTPRPKPFINSGIFLPPKSKRMITRIIMISGAPNPPKSPNTNNEVMLFKLSPKGTKTK